MPPRAWITRFVLVALAVGLVVVGLGWFTGTREVMYGALLAAAAFAFLPFVLIVIGLALLVLCILVAITLALFSAGEGAAEAADASLATPPIVEAGSRMLAPYYVFLARQQHPAFWGIPAGILLGGLTLVALVFGIILPGETRTAALVLHAVAAIESHRKETGCYPEPLAGQRLPQHVLTPEAPAEAAVIDAFGRPFLYEVAGPRLAASFRLISLGYDGRRGRDDLCGSGATKLAAALGKAQDLLAGLGRGKPPSIVEKLQAVRALRCED